MCIYRLVRLTARWGGLDAGQEGPPSAAKYFLGYYRHPFRWNP